MGASPETDLIFNTEAGAIYEPLKIKSEYNDPDSVDVTVTNMNLDHSLSDLGIYIRPSSNLGPWDNPAEEPPATDYQDLLMWGTRSDAEPTVFKGGIAVTVNGVTKWVTRSAGGYYTNRIPVGGLSPSEQLSFKVEFVVPQEMVDGVWTSIMDARRLFVSVVVA